MSGPLPELEHLLQHLRLDKPTHDRAEILKVLVGKLDDPEPHVRYWAVVALARLNNPLTTWAQGCCLLLMR